MSLLGIFKKHKIAVEEQIANLKQLGIALKPEFSSEELFRHHSREELESKPYLMVLFVLGGTIEEEPWTDLSDDIWHFDVECIEDHGDYARIVRRLAELARRDLRISDIHDHVDVDADKAHIAFVLNGTKHEWDLKVNNDWVDEGFISKFVAAAALHSPKRYFAMEDGQAMLVVYKTKEEVSALEHLTILKFDELR